MDVKKKWIREAAIGMGGGLAILGIVLAISTSFSGSRLNREPEGRRKCVMDEVRPKILDTLAGNTSRRPGTETTVDLGNGVKLTLCWCPAGDFTMGYPADNWHVNTIQHRVSLSKGYWMGKYEVTQAQWQQVMGNNPSHFTTSGKNAPVENVSWHDCQEFVRRLNKLVSGCTFRLPTEAEWEYACRAGTTGSWYDKTVTDGNGKIDDLCWWTSNSGGETHTVGQKKANNWNLYDMYGNVWEWCADWYSEYTEVGVTDPMGPDSGSGRVTRGGGWDSIGARGCNSFYRFGAPDFDKRHEYQGMRLAMTAK